MCRKCTSEYQINWEKKNKTAPDRLVYPNPEGEQKTWTFKYCVDIDCHQQKQDIDQFYWIHDKWHSYCKTCVKRMNRQRNIDKSVERKEKRTQKKLTIDSYQHEYFKKNEERIDERTSAYNERNRERINAKNRQWRINNPEEYKAIKELSMAVRRGFLIRPDTCECCLQTPKRKKVHPIQYHHYDYTQPLEVLALCNSCHKRWHGGQPDIIAKCDILWAKKMEDKKQRDKNEQS